MKKLLAILLALSMLVVFAACGSKTEDESTEPAESESVSEEVSEDASEAETEDATEAASEEASEAVSEEASETTSEDASEAASEDASETESTTEENKIPQTTEEIVAYYNAARKATKPAPKGKQTMALNGSITGDGAIGTIAPIITKAADSALSKNSKETDTIPAWDHPDIKVSDVKSATAKDDGKGNVVVTIYFKEQTDGSNGDSKNGGPVARGVGTLGSIDIALEEMGATLTEGRDTVKLTYTDAYAKNVVINQKTGKITGGEWHYLVKVYVGNAKAKLGISLNLININAQVDYKVVIPG